MESLLEKIDICEKLHASPKAAEWTRRVNSMKQVEAAACALAMASLLDPGVQSTIVAAVQGLVDGFRAALTDTRPAVIKQTCSLVGTLAWTCGTAFEPITEALLVPVLLMATKKKQTQVIALAARQCLHSLCKATQFPISLLQKAFHAGKHDDNLRMVCMSLVVLILRYWDPDAVLAREVYMPLREIVLRSVRDKEAAVQAQGRMALCLLCEYGCVENEQTRSSLRRLIYCRQESLHDLVTVVRSDVLDAIAAEYPESVFAMERLHLLQAIENATDSLLSVIPETDFENEDEEEEAETPKLEPGEATPWREKWSDSVTAHAALLDDDDKAYWLSKASVEAVFEEETMDEDGTTRPEPVVSMAAWWHQTQAYEQSGGKMMHDEMEEKSAPANMPEDCPMSRHHHPIAGPTMDKLNASAVAMEDAIGLKTFPPPPSGEDQAAKVQRTQENPVQATVAGKVTTEKSKPPAHNTPKHRRHSSYHRKRDTQLELALEDDRAHRSVGVVDTDTLQEVEWMTPVKMASVLRGDASSSQAPLPSSAHVQSTLDAILLSMDKLDKLSSKMDKLTLEHLAAPVSAPPTTIVVPSMVGPVPPHAIAAPPADSLAPPPKVALPSKPPVNLHHRPLTPHTPPTLSGWDHVHPILCLLYAVFGIVAATTAFVHAPPSSSMSLQPQLELLWEQKATATASQLDRLHRLLQNLSADVQQLQSPSPPSPDVWLLEWPDTLALMAARLDAQLASIQCTAPSSCP
ncbi:Aste57867_13961 [Aphanomyces stellatus]|uniref:Aste57867_13961 protein n=1 Tax=Aphanomyces stellatus TaxID=120398 RepID=A0A485L0E1_9STRA|nr:hypothetical protein As57867_013910 [Aphanomyces stellatus]VFT90791.1 Aste57867_13961 [Aphanomyces stellatus]